MTHLCCLTCRLRFSLVIVPSVSACPQCGSPTQAVASPEQVLGWRLATLQGPVPPWLPEAVAVSLPAPDLRHRRS